MKCINCPHGFHGVAKRCGVIIQEVYDNADETCSCKVQPSLALSAIQKIRRALDEAVPPGPPKYDPNFDDVGN